MFSWDGEFDGGQGREPKVPDFESLKRSNIKARLESAGWTVEPPLEGVREDIHQPWFEMTREIDKQETTDNFKKSVLRHARQTEWPNAWIVEINLDEQEGLRWPHADETKTYAKVSYIGDIREPKFEEFSRALADVFSAKPSLVKRWLGRLGLRGKP